MKKGDFENKSRNNLIKPMFKYYSQISKHFIKL